MGFGGRTGANLLGRIHLLAEVLGLDHMRGKKEVQSIAKPMDVTKSILLRIVGTLVVHHIRWRKRYHGGRRVRDRGGNFLHHGRVA